MATGRIKQQPETKPTGRISSTSLSSVLLPSAETVKKRARQVGDYVRSLRGVRPIDVVREIPGQFSKQVGQPSLRAYAALSSVIRKPLTPTGQFQQDLYGTQEPITIRSVGEEVVGKGSKLALPVGAALSVGDLFGGSGGRVVRLSSKLAKLTDEVKIASEIDQAIPSFRNNPARSALIKTISKESKPENIQKIIEGVVKKQSPATGRVSLTKRAEPSVERPQITPDSEPLAAEARKYKSAEEFVRAQEGEVMRIFNRDAKLKDSDYEDFNKLYREVQESVDVPKELRKDLPKDITGQEAISRVIDNSAGEQQYDFVEKVADALRKLGYDDAPYFGERVEIPNIVRPDGSEVPAAIRESDLLRSYMRDSRKSELRKIYNRATASSRIDEALPALPSPTETYAKTLKSTQEGRPVGKGRLNTKLEDLVQNSRTFDDFTRRAGVTPEALDKTAKARGYESARDYYTNLKPQLDAAERLKRPTKLEVTPNLLKKISEEKMPGPIVDSIREVFPNISDRTLSLFANRLAKLKRTTDIEGHLNTLSSLSKDMSLKSEAVQKALKKEVAKKPGKDIKQDLLNNTLGKTTLNLLSESEQREFVENLTRTVKDEKEAVLAQQEYDLIWESLGQKIFDRYEELQMRKAMVEEVLDNMPAKGLLKYVSKTTGRLPEVTGKHVMDSLTGSGKKVKTSEFGVRGDDIITELGFSNLDEASEGLDQYRKTEEDMKWIKDELRELKPKLSAARFLSPMIDDVPVLAQKRAGAIDSITNPERIRYDYKDISGFSGGFRDLWRNFETFFGKHFEEAKAQILDPLDDSKGAFIDELDKIADSLDEQIVKKFGFKKGSKESAAIQRFGDTGLPGGERMTEGMLLDEFGSATTQKIKEADKWFRDQYDRMIDEVNEVREKIYPNNPSKLIPKRKDYYRHFRELGEGFQGLYDILFEVPAGIEPKLVGLSERTKPKSKFLSFAQERTGKKTEIDAIGGFINYANAFSYAKHIDPNIGSFRYLRRKIAENAKRPGTKDEDGEIEGVNNFIEYLDDFANSLAGKTNPFDRYIQKRIPGGRKMLQALNWFNSRAKANAVVSASGGLSQVLNFPQVIAETKTFFPGGAKQTFADMFGAPGPISESTFIKERYSKPLTERFPIDWDAHKVKRTGEEVRKVGRFVMTALDEVITKAAWNANYNKALAQGLREPVRYADDITRKLVAGRGIGEVPIDQQGRVFQTLAPFMVEVMNGWWIMKNYVSKREYTSLATFFASTYLINEMLENIRGSRGSYDPINALMEGFATAEDEWQNDNYDRAVYKFLGRQVGEILSNIPAGQQLAAGVTDEITKKYLGVEKKELFGQGDPGRFGSPFLLSSAIKDPFWTLATPIGGIQAKRTYEAVKAMLEGEVDTKDGKLSFKVSSSPTNIIKSVLFGKNATEEAHKTFDKSDDLFQRVYRQDYERSEFRLGAEKKWKEIEQTKGRDEKAKLLAKIKKDDPKLFKAMVDIKKEQNLGLDRNDRLVKMLGVENGERAKYIAEELKGMKTRKEKAAFLQNLVDKKLLSKQVAKQLKVLMSKTN